MARLRGEMKSLHLDGRSEGFVVTRTCARNRGHQKVVRRPAELRKALLEVRVVKFSDL